MPNCQPTYNIHSGVSMCICQIVDFWYASGQIVLFYTCIGGVIGQKVVYVYVDTSVKGQIVAL